MHLCVGRIGELREEAGMEEHIGTFKFVQIFV